MWPTHRDNGVCPGATGANDGDRQAEADHPAGPARSGASLGRPQWSGRCRVVPLEGRPQLAPDGLDDHRHTAVVESIGHVVPPIVVASCRMPRDTRCRTAVVEQP